MHFLCYPQTGAATEASVHAETARSTRDHNRRAGRSAETGHGHRPDLPAAHRAGFHDDRGNAGVPAAVLPADVCQEHQLAENAGGGSQQTAVPSWD